MSDQQKSSGRDVFRELETQNPDIARVFYNFRLQSEGIGGGAIVADHDKVEYRKFELVRDIPMHVFIPTVLLSIGIIAISAAVGLVRFLIVHYQAILLSVGGACVGVGVILLVIPIGSSPLRTVTPPKAFTEDPLQELKDLTERTVSRLRTAYRLQLCSVLAVGSIFVALIVWSMVMVSQDRILYASAFGSSGIAMVILTQWKWQPFDRINKARQLADKADTLATGLRLRIATISEIDEPSKRAKAQWNAVKDYLAHS